MEESKGGGFEHEVLAQLALGYVQALRALGLAGCPGGGARFARGLFGPARLWVKYLFFFFGSHLWVHPSAQALKARNVVQYGFGTNTRRWASRWGWSDISHSESLRSAEAAFFSSQGLSFWIQ